VRLAADGTRECALARWGLVPGWAPDLKFGARCINARAETVAKLPAFRGAFRRRRCLVPVNAFFEWSGEKGERMKWRISLREEPLFALAGLWEWWQDREKWRGGHQLHDRHLRRQRGDRAAARPHAGDPARNGLRALA